MFALLKKKNNYQDAAREVYAALLKQSRDPRFYSELRVPDNFTGRFDLLVLHLFIVINRLNADGAEGRAFAQNLFDAAFQNMDQTLREAGIGDMGVPKRMKKMMVAFNGRMHAYDAAMNNNEAFHDAILRNVYGSSPNAPAIDIVCRTAAYALTFIENLNNLSLTDIAQGRMAPPEI